jgi:hypothetical protein
LEEHLNSGGAFWGIFCEIESCSNGVMEVFLEELLKEFSNSG